MPPNTFFSPSSVVTASTDSEVRNSKLFMKKLMRKGPGEDPNSSVFCALFHSDFSFHMRMAVVNDPGEVVDIFINKPAINLHNYEQCLEVKMGSAENIYRVSHVVLILLDAQAYDNTEIDLGRAAVFDTISFQSEDLCRNVLIKVKVGSAENVYRVSHVVLILRRTLDAQTCDNTEIDPGRAAAFDDISFQSEDLCRNVLIKECFEIETTRRYFAARFDNTVYKCARF